MLQRSIWAILLTACGAGLLVSWMPQATVFQSFQVLVYALVIAWLAGFAAGRMEGARWPWLLMPLLAIIIWGAVQLGMGWSVYRLATIGDMVRWGTYGSIFFLAFQTGGSQRGEHRFCRILTVYGFVLVLVSIFQFFLGHDGRIFWTFTPGEPPSGLGPFINRDHFASFVALVIPAAAVEMQKEHGRRWVFGIITAVLYAAVIASASRAGFALVTLEVVVLFLLLQFPGKVVGATSLLMAAFVLVVGWETLYERLLGPDPYAGRREVAQATVQMIRSEPWTGTGLGTWIMVYPEFAKKDFGVTINAAHNDWLQWAADGGIPMAGMMFALFCGSIVILRRAPWALGVPIVYLHCLIDFPMQGRFLPAVVFLVLGVAARAATRKSY